MKNLKVFMLLSTIVLVSACNNSNDDDDPVATVTPVTPVTTPSFTELARDIFAQSANSEPKQVELGVTFKVTDSDASESFNDLLNQ